MLIPQALAYALLAGMPPQTGLYASMLPLLAYALCGSSRTLSVGPMAVLALMTAAAAGQVATQGSLAYSQAVIALALLSGAVLVAMALLRLGWVTNLLSHSVVNGLILASALLIIGSQLRHLIGMPLNGATLPALLVSFAHHWHEVQPVTLTMGLASLLALFALRRLGGRWSRFGPLLVLAGATAISALAHLDHHGLAVVGEIPAGLPALALPDFAPSLWKTLAVPALLIALVGFVESVSVAQALAAKRRQRIDANRELAGLGLANLASAISGGFPVTGGLSRSVVNHEAGARTPMAGILTAAGLALAALFLTPWLHYLPKATLAAIIIVAVTGLIRPRDVKRVWRFSRVDFISLLTTLLGVLLVGISTGVLAGLLCSLLLYLWQTSQPHMAELGQVPGSEHFRNVQRHRVVMSAPVLSVRVDESLYFANARRIEEHIYNTAVQRPEVRHVVLLCSAINHIDASALDSLESLNRRLADAGVKLHLSEVKGPVMDQLRHSDFPAQLSGQTFLSHFQALRTLDPDSAHRGLLPAAPGPR